MTIKELIQMCENIKDSSTLMIYHSVEDYDNCTCNWNSCRAESATHMEARIAKFKIDDYLIVIALA